jgi:hypothetical protein
MKPIDFEFLPNRSRYSWTAGVASRVIDGRAERYLVCMYAYHFIACTYISYQVPYPNSTEHTTGTVPGTWYPRTR